MKTLSAAHGGLVRASLPIRSCSLLNHPSRGVSSLGSSQSTFLRSPNIGINTRQSVQRRQRKEQHVPQALLEETIHAITDTPLRDVLAVGFSIIGAKVLVGIFEYLEETKVIDKKLSRKLVHTLAGPLFLVCWPLFSSAPYAQYLAALVPSLNGIRLVLAGTETVKDPRAIAAMTRTGDPAELLRGPLYYVIVLLSVTALYWRESPVGLVVTSLMCGGDGLADIIGRRFGGSNPLPWNPEKSWAGTGAMFLGGLSMALCLLWYFSALGYQNLEFSTSAGVLVIIAFVASLIESLPINKTLDDNLSVPGVAALLGTMMLQVMVV